MARIAFFTERIPPSTDPIATFSYDLIRSLADQQHDIRIYSTYFPQTELPLSHPRIEILRPFRTWSWLEVPRLIPLLMDFKPEILHIIQPHAEMNTLSFMKITAALPALGPILGRARSVLSVYEEPKLSEQKRFGLLVRACDLVTVSHRNQYHHAIALGAKTAKLRLLPVSALGGAPDSLGDKGIESQNKGLSEFRAKHSRFFFVPGSFDQHQSVTTLMLYLEKLATSLESGIIVSGSTADLPHYQRSQILERLNSEDWAKRVYICGLLDSSLEADLFRNARAVILTTLRPDTLTFQKHLRNALQFGVVPILSADQVDGHPLPWSHGENAWILDPASGAQFDVTWPSDMDVKLKTGIRQLADRQATDHPGNLMSRWYSQLLRDGFITE